MVSRPTTNATAETELVKDTKVTIRITRSLIRRTRSTETTTMAVATTTGTMTAMRVLVASTKEVKAVVRISIKLIATMDFRKEEATTKVDTTTRRKVGIKVKSQVDTKQVVATSRKIPSIKRETKVAIRKTTTMAATNRTTVATSKISLRVVVIIKIVKIKTITKITARVSAMTTTMGNSSNRIKVTRKGLINVRRCMSKTIQMKSSRSILSLKISINRPSLRPLNLSLLLLESKLLDLTSLSRNPNPSKSSKSRLKHPSVLILLWSPFLKKIFRLQVPKLIRSSQFRCLQRQMDPQLQVQPWNLLHVLK